MLIKRARNLPIFILAFTILFSFGFYVAAVDDSRPIWLRNTAFEIYHFFAGAAEEQTSAREKLFFHFSGSPRKELNAVTAPRKRGSVFSFQLDNGLKIVSTVGVEALEDLAFFNSANDGKTTIVRFSDGKVFSRMFGKPFTDFDVKKNILVRLSESKLSAIEMCHDGKIWEKNGAFHHYFTASREEGLVAVFGLELARDEIEREKKILGSRIFSDAIHNVAIYELTSGELRKSFDFFDIALANSQSFDPLVIEWLSKYRKEIKPGLFVATQDFWHPNDIEFVPSGFGVDWLESDDLIVSAKGFNMLFIFSTRTLEIKFFSQGLFQGQHDPDFSSAGLVTVFNNRNEINGADTFSSIDYLNLLDGSHGEVLSGRGLGGITRHSGGHSIGKRAISMDVTLAGTHLIFDKKSKTFLGEVRFMNGDTFLPTKASKKIEMKDVGADCPAWKEEKLQL